MVRRITPEWLVAIAFVAATIWLVQGGRVYFKPADVAIYYHLASAFSAGFVAVIGVVLAELMLRALPRSKRRTWRLASFTIAGTIAIAIFAFVRPPGAFMVISLLEALALGAVGLVGFLTIFLPVAGLLPALEPLRAMGRFVRIWGPLFSYILCGGVWLLAIRLDTPMVWDPVIFRMDASFGFVPIEAVFAWVVDRRWVEIMSNWGYPLLGTLLAVVTAALFLGGETSQTRRCVLVILLVGILGLVCYRLVPVVSPLFAFNGLFIQPQNDWDRATVDAVRDFAMNGPRLIPGPPTAARNTMPSLHTAFALVVLIAAWNFRRRLFWIVLPIGCLQIVTTLTLCVHYVVDLIAAVPFALLCWWIADLGIRASLSPGDTALPPIQANAVQVIRRSSLFLASVAVSIAALIWWALQAPIPPWLAWCLSLLCMAGPSWAALRLYSPANRRQPSQVHAQPRTRTSQATAMPVNPANPVGEPQA